MRMTFSRLCPRISSQVTVQTGEVSRDWTEGWRDHFKPIVIGEVRIRPPWEAPADPGGPLVDVVINPGLGFGTGLHPTTRGTLTLLQEPGPEGDGAYFLGPAGRRRHRLGHPLHRGGEARLGPGLRLRQRRVALMSARENIVENGVAGIVEMHQTDVDGASIYWFSGATVLANMTLDPVLALLAKLPACRGSRVVPVRARRRAGPSV